MSDSAKAVPAMSRPHQMVSFPRELDDDMAELIAEKARVCGGGAYDIWEMLCARFGKPAAQHQGEPAAYQWRCKTVHEGSQWRHWVDCTEEDYRRTIESPGPTSRGIVREARKLYTQSDPGFYGRAAAREAQKNRESCAKLAERDALLHRWVGNFGHLGGCATPLRDETKAALSVSAESSAREAQALKDESRLGIERLPAEPSAPVECGLWRPITASGQVQEGDWLSFTVAGSFICAQARLIINPGTAREEIIYNRQKNHYFVTSMAIDGTSTHKGVLVAKSEQFELSAAAEAVRDE